MKGRIAGLLAGTLCGLGLSACAYNPFIDNNHTTGTVTGTAVGAGAGVGTMALLGGSKSFLVLGGLGGGAAGYYVSSMRYAASGIIQAGGQVYILGDYVGIYLPTDKVFEPNTARLTPDADIILASVASVLNRKPNNNILISGNTSGFALPQWEKKLSTKRAKAVAANLWKSGVTAFKQRENDTRKLNYVGYGNYYPIASNLTNQGIRSNSRIQITSYPCAGDLVATGNEKVFHNVGEMDVSDPDKDKLLQKCGPDPDAC